MIDLRLEPNNLYQGDCLELMHHIEDSSIDMILADLPYGITACHWDTIIPLEPLWAHYKRIIKPKGAIVLTANQPFTTSLMIVGRDIFRHNWVWDKRKSSNVASAKNRPLRTTEDVLVFSTDGSVNYYPVMRQGKLRRKGGGKVSKINGISRTYTVNDLYFPKDIIRISNANFENRGLHPTQKPVALFAYLIRTYTNPGDLVLDNVAGSGTTGVACINEGREFILIEQDPEYFKIAQDRIAERLKQPFLPGLDTVANEPPLTQSGFFDD